MDVCYVFVYEFTVETVLFIDKSVKKTNCCNLQRIFLDDIDVFCTFAYKVYVVVLLFFDGYVAQTSLSLIKFGHMSQSISRLPNGQTMIMKTYVHDKYLNVLSSYGTFNARVNPNGYAYQYYIWAGVESTFMGETRLFELIKNPGDEVFEIYPSYYYENGVQYSAFSTLQAAYISQDIAPVIIIE